MKEISLKDERNIPGNVTMRRFCFITFSILPPPPRTGGDRVEQSQPTYPEGQTHASWRSLVKYLCESFWEKFR